MSNTPRNIVQRFAWGMVSAVVRHDIASLAAVITFYAFFSLFPLILLILYTASVFLPEAQIEKALLDMLRPYFPDVTGANAKTMIEQHIAELANFSKQVGLFSAVTLTWSAMSGFIAVQQAMDVIWETEQRSFLARRAISFVMLVIVLLVTLSSAIITALYPAVKHLPIVHGQDLSWFGWVHNLSRILFPLSLFVVFVIFYRYLPSRRTGWSFVIPGAAIAAATLDIGRSVFVWYASHLVRYQMVYGGLTAVMLLVLWMYIGAILMLFGAEVSAELERLTAAFPESISE